MPTLITRPVRALALVALLSLTLSACDDQNVNLTPEEAVSIRAQAWMDTLLFGDYKGAYEYTSPNYRSFASSGRYHARVEGAARWKTGIVDSIACEDQLCRVRYIVEYDIRSMNISNRRPLDYKWIYVDGEWWLFVPTK